MLKFHSDSDSEDGRPYTGQMLIDSYSYPAWRASIKAYLVIYGFRAALEPSLVWKNGPYSETDLAQLYNKKPIRHMEYDPAEIDNEDILSVRAQIIILQSLSRDIQIMWGWSSRFPSAAALWDYLYIEYGKPDWSTVSLAMRRVFPGKKLQVTDDILGHVYMQRRAAHVLNAADSELSERLLNLAHLWLLPPQYFLDVPQLFDMQFRSSPADLDFKEIIKYIRLGQSLYPEKVKQHPRCYHHHTVQHDVSECRVVRGLWRDIRRLSKKNMGRKKDEEEEITAIFDIPEDQWYCDEHHTRDHDDKWCVKQLRRGLSRLR